MSKSTDRQLTQRNIVHVVGCRQRAVIIATPVAVVSRARSQRV